MWNPFKAKKDPRDKILEFLYNRQQTSQQDLYYGFYDNEDPKDSIINVEKAKELHRLTNSMAKFLTSRTNSKHELRFANVTFYQLNANGIEFWENDGYKGQAQRKLDAIKAKVFDWLKILVPVFFAFWLGRCEKDEKPSISIEKGVPYSVVDSLQRDNKRQITFIERQNKYLTKKADSIQEQLINCGVTLRAIEQANVTESRKNQ